LWVVERALPAYCCSSVPYTPRIVRCFSIDSSSIHAFEVGCAELVLGLGESLIRPVSGQ
jgi:hypothetical protein